MRYLERVRCMLSKRVFASNACVQCSNLAQFAHSPRALLKCTHAFQPCRTFHISLLAEWLPFLERAFSSLLSVQIACISTLSHALKRAFQHCRTLWSVHFNPVARSEACISTLSHALKRAFQLCRTLWSKHFPASYHALSVHFLHFWACCTLFKCVFASNACVQRSNLAQFARSPRAFLKCTRANDGKICRRVVQGVYRIPGLLQKCIFRDI